MTIACANCEYVSFDQLCTHPLATTYQVSYYTGQQVSVYLSVTVIRDVTGPCGPNATLFAKPPPISTAPVGTTSLTYGQSVALYGSPTTS